MTDTDTSQLAWRKSRYSSGHGGACVEVAPLLDGGMAVRDSKDPSGPALRFTPVEWDAFTAGVRGGEFDRAGGLGSVGEGGGTV